VFFEFSKDELEVFYEQLPFAMLVCGEFLFCGVEGVDVVVDEVLPLADD